MQNSEPRNVRATKETENAASPNRLKFEAMVIGKELLARRPIASATCLLVQRRRPMRLAMANGNELLVRRIIASGTYLIDQ